MPKITKPWYKRRRYWTLAFLAVAVYFCLIPSPLRVSPETTGVTSPLLPNGDVDYFGLYEQTYIHKLSPPEDNGMRLLLAACGPSILEQMSIVDTVSWEHFPTDERSKHWFENYWLPLCEHMYIDPYAKPRFLNNPNFYRFVRDEWVAAKKDNSDSAGDLNAEGWKAAAELHQKLIATPWTAEEYPHVAQWVEERSPLLDLFGVAVRKPNFVCWRQRPESGNLYAVSLPDVQANRNFGRELPIRVTERLGRGDIDGAWYDVMSMFYLSRNHYVHDAIIVTNLVGIAVEMAGWESAKVILQHGEVTPEQLERFAQDLNSLPRKMVAVSESERYSTYSGLQLVQTSRDAFEELVGRSEAPITNLETFFLYLFGGANDSYTVHFIPRYITLLPFDRNIAGKRVTEFLQTEWQRSGDSAWHLNPTAATRHFENMEQRFFERGWELNSHWSLLRFPLIRTRSELIADYVLSRFYPAFRLIQFAFDRTNTHFELLRLAVALERYRSANGGYPADLEALVPQFLEEVPMEPLTGRKSFVYKVTPDEATAFLIHSSEWDEKDGNKRELLIRLGVGE